MKKIYMFLAALVITITSKSQVSSYGFNQFSGSYSAITGGTVFGTTTSDDQYFVDPSIPAGGFTSTGPGIPIGFNFVFNGTTFDVVGIQNNGWISLGNSTITPDPVDMSTFSNYQPISNGSSAPPTLQNLISALAHDLQGQTGSSLRAQTIGTAPNRTFVVQFTNYRRYLGSGDSYDFQIRLSETSNNVDIVYGTFTTGSFGSATEVGLRGTSNTDFNNREVTTPNIWATSNAGAFNFDAINYDNTLTPASGQTYQWSPPPLCTGTPSSGISSISTPSGCPNATFVLNATNLSSASGLTYQWQSAPSATGPWTNITSANTIMFTYSVATTTYFQLVTTCTVSALSASSSVSSYSIVNPGPCVCGGYGQSSATNAFDEEIWNVTFGSLNNTSNCTTTGPGPGSVNQLYSNYAGFLPAPTVMQGQSVPYSVDINTCGGWFVMNYDIYIDFNQNGLFTDAGELVANVTGAIQGVNSGVINIPITAAVGTTRMRVVAVEFSTPSPTGTYGYGETEDYCIDIAATTACAGTPNSGTSSISIASGCPNVLFNLTTSGLTVASGLTYQWYSSPSATGPWTAISNATNTTQQYSVSATTYFQLVTTCTVSSQSATTTVSNYSVVNPGPCICSPYGPSNATQAFDEEIWGVVFGTLNNPSTCTTTAPGPGSVNQKYSNYAGFVTAPTVQQGQTVSYTVDINTCGGWFGMNYGVYIDFNQNGSFADAGENVANVTGAIQGLNTGNVTIPVTALVGNTRMRIVAVEFAAPTPTGTYGYGETEDYCINITAAVPCSGTPASGTSTIDIASGCPNILFNLTTNSLSVASGLTYQWYSSSSPTGPWTAISNATSTAYSSSVSTTTYFQMVTTCTNSSQSATTSVSSYSVVNPGPCVCAGYASSSATSTFDEELLNVTFATLNNSSTCSSVGPGPGSVMNKYSNYAGFLAAPTVTQGQTVTFTIQIGTCNGNYNNSASIYIDYNQNGLFTDAGEQVYLSAATTNGPHFESGSVTIPMTASVGITRMRVISNETSPAFINPTGTYSWGETEDYCIDIAQALPCTGTPASGTAAISQATACPNSTLNLNGTGLTTGLGIQYQWYSSPSATGPWSAVPNATSTSYATSTNVTTYYQIVTTCTNSAQSATSSVVSFSVVNPGPCICNNYGASNATQAFDEEIWNVTFGSLNNPSTCTTTAPGPGSVNQKYSNYAGFVAAPTVMQGQNVPYSVDINTCGGWFGMNYDVYIDFNQNGLFTDAGEQVASVTGAIQGVNSGIIGIPATASVGTTRMRVVAVEFSTPSPTGTYGYGETEDYCIDIIAPMPCAGTPSSGIAAISTNTGCITDVFTMNATSITIATGITYQWYSSPSPTGPWTAITNASNTAFATSASVTTFFQMVTTCSNSAQSATTSIVSYTPSNCYTMSNNTITSCSGTLYDSGGPNGNYTNNEDYTLTIIPAASSSSVLITFNTFSTEPGFDYLYVYDGNSTAAPLIGQYDNSNPPPASIAASSAGGELTLQFTSDVSVVYSGFDISITCTSTCSGPPSAPAVTSMSLCSGNTATLTAVATGTAAWYTTPTASTAPVSTSTLFVTPTLTGNITYYVKDSTACGSSSLVAVNVTVVTTPTMVVSSTSNTLCAGQSATLSATSMDTYTWSTAASTSVIVVTPTTTTSYTVTGNQVQCVSTQTGAVNINVNALPTVTMSASGVATICATNGSIALQGGPSGGVFSGAAVTGTLLSIVNAGTYTPMYTYTAPTTGCSNSASVQVIVINCSAGLVSQMIVTPGFNVYPNPNTGSFIIETNTTISKQVEITDLTGRIVKSETSDEPRISMDIKDLANGIYYVRVVTDGATHVVKIIKQ